MIRPAFSALLKPAAAGGASFSDNFNRSDRALNGDNGWAWLVGSTGFDIVSNELQIGSAAGDNSQVNSGLSIASGFVQADAKIASGAGIGLIFRCQDSSNFYLLDFDLSVFFWYKRSAGTYSSFANGSWSTSWTAGTYKTIKVAFSGSNFELFQDGVSQGTTSDSTFSAAGTTGLRNGSGGTGARTVDNFSAGA